MPITEPPLAGRPQPPWFEPFPGDNSPRGGNPLSPPYTPLQPNPYNTPTTNPDILSTSATSPDSLPQKGYTVDQLADYIFRQLGYPTWNVELTKQQVVDCVNDALALFSKYCPSRQVIALRMIPNVNVYLQGVDLGQGVVQVDFVEPLPTPTAIFYGNLIDPTPLFKVGMDDYDTYMRWRKTWMRVMSISPDYYYDEMQRILYIHNPIERYNAAVFYYANHTDTRFLPYYGATWVKEYALAKARYTHGEVLAKFGGAVPGPVRDIQLDKEKRTLAIAQIDKLETQVRGMAILTPISID